MFCSLAMTAGCSYNQTLKDAWKYTDRQYRSYLNTPATLDMEATGSCENYELALGDAVMEVDGHLQSLVRTMENSDQSPDQSWVIGLIRKYPWLTGVALADPNGVPMARYPEYFMKEFDVSPLLEPDPKQRIGSLRAYVQETPLGPEVYLANPVYIGEELRGLVVVYFDPRALVTMSTDPGSFMLTYPGGVLWSGRYSAQSTPVGQADWADLVQRRSCGLVGGSGTEFFWTTRYVGNLPVIYAIPTDAGNLVESQKSLNELKRVDVSDAPPLQLNDPYLSEGEVGNLGSPNVAPSPVSAPSGSDEGAMPLAE